MNIPLGIHHGTKSEYFHGFAQEYRMSRVNIECDQMEGLLIAVTLIFSDENNGASSARPGKNMR
jgi:hypothetical protein